jgi:hypothetical protein
MQGNATLLINHAAAFSGVTEEGNIANRLMKRKEETRTNLHAGKE